MRAATAIVGAIAVASILIALAFIFSGGSDSRAIVTKTVEIVTTAKSTETEKSSGPETSRSTFGGPKECDGGAFTVENVSCEIGAQIREGFEEGARGEILAEDQEAGETISMSCSGAAPTECTGPGGAKVYFGD